MRTARRLGAAITLLASTMAGGQAAEGAEQQTVQGDLVPTMERLLEAACDSVAPPRLALVEAPSHYDRTNLYERIDGGAERYLGYSFDAAAFASAEGAGESFGLELYHFAASADAYGLWSTDAVGEPVDVGQRSVYGSGLLQFWRGSYFARVYHSRYLDSRREAILALGRGLADAVGGDGALPELLSALPGEGLRGTPVFFHEQPVLNTLYYLSDANLLRLGPDTDAVFADYERGEERAKLLVLEYRSAKATPARRAFITSYLELRPGPGIRTLKLENDLWSGVGGAEGRLLRLVFDASSQRLAVDLLMPPPPPTDAGG